LDVDASFEDSAILDADARRDDIADQLRALPDFDFVAGLDVALHLSEDDDVTGADAGLDAAGWSDGDLVIRRIDRALDIAVDIEVFFRKYLANNFYSLPDRSGTARLRVGHQIGC